jgi:CheY-like chemotaxis protein
MDGDREKCLESGMDDYIPKPLRREQLVSVLRARIPEPSVVAANGRGAGTHAEGPR